MVSIDILDIECTIHKLIYGIHRYTRYRVYYSQTNIRYP